MNNPPIKPLLAVFAFVCLTLGFLLTNGVASVLVALWVALAVFGGLTVTYLFVWLFWKVFLKG